MTGIQTHDGCSKIAGKAGKEGAPVVSTKWKRYNRILMKLLTSVIQDNIHERESRKREYISNVKEIIFIDNTEVYRPSTDMRQ